MNNLASIRDADGYGMLDASDKRGHKNTYIDYVQKLALDQEGAFRADDVILDFGCGVGRFCSWLSHRSRRIYGVDTSREMLALAAQYNARQNVLYQMYDGYTLPFPQSCFDAALCVFGGVLHKHLFPEKHFSHLIGELARVVKTPGTIIAVEHVYRKAKRGYYQREEFIAHFTQHDFHCSTYYPVRRGHWPLLYLIRWGLIPHRLFPQLARYELRKRRHEREAYFDYKDYLFRFEKKGGT